MEVSFLEQVKIQSRILVPFVKALQQEIGEQRANEFVKRVLGNRYRTYGKTYWAKQEADSANQKLHTLWDMFAGGEAVEYDVVSDTPNEFNLDIKRCGYAAFFKDLDEPELGFLFCCSNDVPMSEGFGSDIKLDIKQTIMQGASHCMIRYRLNEANDEA